MKRFWPLFVIAVGMGLLVGGFIYDVIFAGIPYQDPTPEMSARYALHSRIASITRWMGVAAFLFGCMGCIIRLSVRRFRRLSVS